MWVEYIIIIIIIIIIIYNIFIPPNLAGNSRRILTHTHKNQINVFTKNVHYIQKGQGKLWGKMNIGGDERTIMAN